MSFPLHIGGREVPDPPSLAALVRADAGATSGQVVPGQRPHQWIAELVASGALAPRLALGLAAALLQHPEAATICEGARLAAAMGERTLGAVVLEALRAHDTALLLRADPGDPAGPERPASASVEDTLLRAAVALCDLADDGVRGFLLERLRNAGLPQLEIPILAAWGSAFELRTWLPAVLAEPLPEAGAEAFRARIARGDEGAAVLRELLGG